MQGDAAAASASLFKQRNALAGQIVSDEAATFWICYRKSVSFTLQSCPYQSSSASVVAAPSKFQNESKLKIVTTKCTANTYS